MKTDLFFQYVEPFMDYRKTVYEVSDQTMRSNKADLSLFEKFIKQRNFTAISGKAVINFQKYLKEERANSGASLNRKIFTLRSFGKFIKLHEPQQAAGLPFKDILKIRQGYKQGPQALTVDQVQVFFESIDRTSCLGIRDYAIYGLMYGLGLRIGEVHGLNIESLNLKNNTLIVIGKGSRRRVMNLTGELPRILAEYLTIRSRFLNANSNNAFLISKKGNRLSIRTMEDNFKNILDRSGIITWFKVTCHTLRHCFASHLNDQGVEIMALQSLLGHSTPKSTQIYIHPSMQKLREALERLLAVIYMNQLLRTGAMTLKFQARGRDRPSIMGVF
ncbi:tyrosine-type recombinase/integrase [bacterium]|nr:tyrosine-type recombinase/integrase [bacterium]